MSKAKTKAATPRKAVCVRQVGRDVNGTTYCGRPADMYDENDWTFTDPNHAVLSTVNRTMLNGQRLEACAECRKVIAALLSGRIPKVEEEVERMDQRKAGVS